MGGGFALADGVQESGLSRLIGEQLRVLDALPAWLLVLVLCLLVASLTETASNAATASIMIPILADLAEALCIHPYYLLYSATIACSFAFMLPVATPPNAIVFGYGVLKIWDMVKAGAMTNLLCISILCISINTYGYFAFGFNTFPSWAVTYPTNHTCFT
ncbi:PREDICTED: solute carrier family 13 member 2-like [Priapulus caudatus]|uniref:Solute carrier family 13 member 2-like n=1 Tax=Priapulus caudatus TaxID=37621 RepID=A0ABM1DWC9_PRICU|nr:PREDICTED: solute carrier family 13 member 2-like [Priapulus caudatus]